MVANRLRVLLHLSHIRFAFGNGLSVVYLCKYALNKSAVCGLSLNERELCPLHPCTLIIPCSASTSVLVVVASSCVSIPVCSRIVKMVAYFLEDALITLYMFSVVGIRGIFLSHL